MAARWASARAAGCLPILASFAHLEGEALEARLPCAIKDHPLFLIPRQERRRLLEERCRPAERGSAEDDFVLSDYVADGEVCRFCHQIFSTLLAAYRGDYLKVLRHVQVERFYVSPRYQEGAVIVEPQLSVDAGWRPILADPRQRPLPAVLQALTLFEPHRTARRSQSRRAGVRGSPEAAARGVQVPARHE